MASRRFAQTTLAIKGLHSKELPNRSDFPGELRELLSIKSGRRPKVSIEGTFLDVQTARSAVRLAAALEGRIDVTSSAPEKCLSEVFEREGWVGATLGEVAERADSILLIGPVEQSFPRLWQTIGGELHNRRILRIAEPENTADHKGIPGKDVLCKSIVDAQDQILHPSVPQGELAKWLLEANYLTILLAGDSLNLLSAGALVRLVNVLNGRDRRAVLVPVSETATFRTTAAWLTGFGGPIQFRSGLPITAQRTYLDGTAIQASPDVRIWLHPFPDSAGPVFDDAKLVVIGAAEATLAERADYYFRTAIPGVEAAGITFRGDGTVALPLSKWQETIYPPAADVLGELAAIW